MHALEQMKLPLEEELLGKVAAAAGEVALGRFDAEKFGSEEASSAGGLRLALEAALGKEYE